MHHEPNNTCSLRRKHLICVGVLGFAAFAAGCAGTRTKRVEYLPDTGSSYAIRPSTNVELVVDGLPERSYADTGTFKAHTASSERSIALIRERAAAAGLDGVYSIDCDTRFNGECVAKGFVYVQDSRQDATAVTASND